ncbi:MAG: hypothetical protein ACYTFA_15580, partial [Planctomycetota bacterium]
MYVTKPTLLVLVVTLLVFTGSARTLADDPCGKCGPGDHWIDACPAGSDLIPRSVVKLGVDLPMDGINCNPDVILVFSGGFTVRRSAPLDSSGYYPECPGGTCEGDPPVCVGGLYDGAPCTPPDGHLDVIDAEIIEMVLTSPDGTMLVAGAGLGQGAVLGPSLGTTVEDPGDPTVGTSFFDVFFELELPEGGGYAYNHDPLRVEANITCAPPDTTFTVIDPCVAVYAGPPGTRVPEVAKVTDLESDDPDGPLPHDPWPTPKGSAFTYQGLLERADTPVTDTTCDFIFSLWDAPDPMMGCMLGVQEENGVEVDNGLFTVKLDFGEPAFPGDARWVMIEVRCPGDPGWTTLDPLVELTPTPYAIYAQNAERVTDGITGRSGTPNYIAKFIGSNTLGNSAIYEMSEDVVNAPRIGIGTTSPDDKLEVLDSIAGGGGITTGHLELGRFSDGSAILAKIKHYIGNAYIGLDSAMDSIALMGGKVGVGTTSPADKLEVLDTLGGGGGITTGKLELGKYADGTAIVAQVRHYGGGGYVGLDGLTDGIYLMSSAVGVGTLNPQGLLQVGEDSFIVTADNWVGVNDQSPDAKLEVSVDGNLTPDLFMLSSDDDLDGDRLIVKNNGDVGIGTASPSAQLHVQTTADSSCCAVQVDSICCGITVDVDPLTGMHGLHVRNAGWDGIHVDRVTGRAGYFDGDVKVTDMLNAGLVRAARFETGADAVIIEGDPDQIRTTTGILAIGKDGDFANVKVGIGTESPLSTLSVGGNGVVGAGVYGTGEYGVYGRSPEDIIGVSTYGYLGGYGEGIDVYGVYGHFWTSALSRSTQGHLASSQYGAYGEYNANNYGFLGADGYGVFGQGETWAAYFQGRGFFSGDVGIGTYDPQANLHISNFSAEDPDTTIRLHDSGVEGAVLTVDLTAQASDMLGDFHGLKVTSDIWGAGRLFISDQVYAGVHGTGMIPTVNKLIVNGSAAIGANYTNFNAPENGLIVEGMVGIGTESPGSNYALHAEGNHRGVYAVASRGSDAADERHFAIVADLDTSNSALTGGGFKASLETANAENVSFVY